jgi:DAK2 domain fusion protein YloV
MDHLPVTDMITSAQFVDAVDLFGEALSRHETTINRLNVYPVPDGDTGTNMRRTVEGALHAVTEGDLDDASMLAALAKGSLMGARGNSGVILSQILRAFSGAFAEGPLDASGYRTMLRRAADAAYSAVLKPVEGTLLTIARRAAEGAEAADGDLVAVAEAARDRALEALAETPSLLSVLRDAGVVDAGGAGLTQLYEACVSVITGRPMPETLTLPPAVAELVALPDGVIRPEPSGDAALDGDGIGDLRYEVMFLLEAPDSAIEGFKERWAEIGASIVVVGADGLFNCHIHTDDIGGSIDAAVAIGRPLQIRVTDLLEQAGELEGHRAFISGVPEVEEHNLIPLTTAVVAVASGAGVGAIFRSLGVAEIVGGGQSMNPSTEELLVGIGAAVAREVIVLPNNANVIPAALQAATLAGRAVVVVPTTSIQAGIAALIAYDPAASAAENASGMEAAIAGVVCGEVTRASRRASTEAGPVDAGSWIGLSDDGVVAVAQRCADAASALVERLVEVHHEVLTVIEGADAPPGEIESFLATVDTRHPGLCVEHLVGGQPVYPILVSLE